MPGQIGLRFDAFVLTTRDSKKFVLYDTGKFRETLALALLETCLLGDVSKIATSNK